MATDEQVEALGRFFAKAMDKRDGLASQEEVAAEVDKVLKAFSHPAYTEPPA